MGKGLCYSSCVEGSPSPWPSFNTGGWWRLKLQLGHACFLPVLHQRLYLLVGFEQGGPSGQAQVCLPPQPGPAPWRPWLRKGAGPRLSRVTAFSSGRIFTGPLLTVFKLYLKLELPPASPQTRSSPVHLPPTPSSICTVTHLGPRGEARL